MSGNNSTRTKHRTNRKDAAPVKVLLNVAPFLLFLVACVFVSAFLLQTFLFNSAEWQYIVSEDKVVIDSEAVSRTMAKYDNIASKEDGTYSIDDFPGIAWGEKWATLTFNTELYGENETEHEVFQGDMDDILSNGVGHFFFSHFPGQGGLVVLSGHVMTDFYVIEEMKVGQTITLNTSYGEYVYRINDIVIFEYNDASLILDKPVDYEEQLVVYTCYPRGYAYRSQRIGLVCEKISGVDFR